ncbi:GDP-L-fucose synthase family protein [Microbulbifer sp. TYP-18]|uniref:GDP-L-fucose synthase n=1 Tax=Microbulbifer sp. TYP-18 TaxID=3230024 RepID=UPI0034C63956
MSLGTRVYVAGHQGMVGAAICRELEQQGFENILVRTKAELDLTNQSDVRTFFAQEKPDIVYLAAAKVGGIHANNTYPAEFIYQNLMLESNVIHHSQQFGVSKLLFLGSSCIYPKLAHQPIREGALLQGTLEPTNEPYAVAKIAGIKLCESYNRQYGTDFRSIMPTNLYGPGDNFHPENSHVIPALIRRFHEARLSQAPLVEIWGTGKPKREFLHVNDMASACVHVMQLDKDQYDSLAEPMLSHINVGTGEDVSIGELAALIAEIVGYQGQVVFNTEMPDGVPRKLLDVSKIHQSGWKSSIPLSQGLTYTYEWYLENSSKPGFRA